MPGKSYKFKEFYPDLLQGLEKYAAKLREIEGLIRKTQNIKSTGAGLKKTNQLYNESANIQKKILEISKEQKQKIKEIAREEQKRSKQQDKYNIDVQKRIAQERQLAKQTRDLANAEVRFARAAKGSLEQMRASLTVLKLRHKSMVIGTRREIAYRNKILQTTNALKAQEQRIGVATRNVGNYGSALTKVTGQITQLVKGFGLMALAWAGFRIGKEAVELAGQLEGVEEAFSRLNNIHLLDDLRKATRGTVTDLDLMKAAVQAKNFKIPLGQLATFFEFATKRAAQTGESVDFLVESIIKGLGRKSVLILDNLGISSIELQKEVKRTGDFAEAAGNIIRQELGSMGDVALTAGQKMTQLKTDTENLKTEIGTGLIPIIIYFGDIMRGIITDIKTSADDIRAIATAFDSLRSSSETVNPKMEQFKEILKTLISPLKAAWEWSMRLLGAYRNVLSTLGLLNEEIEGDTESIFKWNEAFAKSQIIIDNNTIATDKNTTSINKNKTATDKNIETKKLYNLELEKANIGTERFAATLAETAEKLTTDAAGKQGISTMEKLFGTDADLKTVQKRYQVLSTTASNFLKTLDNSKDRSVKKDKRRKQIQKGFDITAAIINTAVAVTDTVKETKGGLIAKILAGVAMGLFGASQVALIASSNYFKGTEYLEFGNYKKGRDTIPFMGPDGSINMASGGERIVDTKTNKELDGFPNPMLPTAVNYYKNAIGFKNNNRNVERLLSEQNGILRNTEQVILKDNILYFVKGGKITGEKVYV